MSKQVKIAPEVDYQKNVPHTNVAIDNITTSYHNPREAPNMSDTIVFDIAPSEELFTDLQNSPLRIRYQIQKRAINTNDWLNIATDAGGEEAETGIVNNILHSLFSQIHLRLNNDLISRSTGLYPHLAHFINAYNYSDDAKRNSLYCEGFIQDTAGSFDAINADNPAYNQRRARIANGRVDELMGVLFFPLSTDALLIPPQTRINLSLQKSPIDFILKRKNNNNEYRVNFINMHWLVKKIRYTESIARTANQVLATSAGGVLPLNYMYPTNHTLNSGQKAYDIEISTGKVPYELVIGIIPTKDFLGDRLTNPFNYSHNNLEEIQLKVEDQSIPLEPLKMDYANQRYTEAYRYTMNSIGQYKRQITSNISYADFPNGFCFYIFNLRPDESTSVKYYPEQRSGNIRCLLKFRADLTAAMTVFVIRSYNNQINVNRIREYTGNMLTY